MGFRTPFEVFIWVSKVIVKIDGQCEYEIFVGIFKADL